MGRRIVTQQQIEIAFEGICQIKNAVPAGKAHVGFAQMGIGNQHEAKLEAGRPVRRGEGVVLGAQQEARFDGQRIGAD